MKMILYMAVSIDGIAALDDEHGIEEYGSPEDRDFFLGRAKKCGAVVMGRKTARHKVGGVPNIVLTHSAKDCRVKPDNDTGAPDNDTVSCSRLTRASFGDGRVYMSGSAQQVYDKIAAMGFKKVALLGGPATNEQFLRAGLVDEIFLTVEPVTIGRGIHFANQPLETRWTLAGVKKLNKRGTLVLHYKAR
ncbi:MAG: dihydrofolate reductase family protein [Treponema sp.]|nr:dihydrofolate reductase family protein [Treponema sp.]